MKYPKEVEDLLNMACQMAKLSVEKLKSLEERLQSKLKALEESKRDKPKD